MASVEIEMRGIKETPEEELDALAGEIRERCDRADSRTLVYLLVYIFAKLVPVYGFTEIISVSDNMGSLTINLHIAGGDYFIKIQYGQSITETWHHVEIDDFKYESHLPDGVSLKLDFNLVSGGWMAIGLYGIGENVKNDIADLLCRSFERTWPLGTTDPHIYDHVKRL